MENDLGCKEKVVKRHSCTFALRVVQLAKYLQGEKQEFGLANQVFGVFVLTCR
jgi:hypothetical protein